MNSYFILFLILSKINIYCSKIISIPFKFKSPKSSYYSYNSSHFFNEYYKKELLLEMNIGTPPQKINAYLNQNTYCIEMLSPESNITNNYYPYESTTFQIDKVQNQNNMFRLIDSYDVYNLNKNESYKLSFVTSETLNITYNKNISLIPDIGINNPMAWYGFFYSCNNFIYDLKINRAIDFKIYSIKYNNKFGGEFIIGNDLSKYDPSHFKEEQYYTKYFVHDFMFTYDEIYMKYPWNKTEYLNITGNSNKKEAIINLNSGLIIGTEDFRNFIHNKFFKYLIEQKNICQLDLIEYNQPNSKLGNEFYIYSCNHMQFTGQANPRYQTINYYKEFLNLVINSKSFEYDFELTNKDLFEQIYSRDYFLIIFPKNIKDQKNKDIWYLGEPFYKKYPFTINLDAKTIGFYLDKKDIIKKINGTKNENKKDNSEKNIIMKDNNSKIKNILVKIAEVMIVILLIFLAYYIGIKVKEGRKKRANELKDDSYEYISDDNKDINNETENETKNKKFVELNSKIGL